jgi:valyl-tRNA synthetase
MRMDELAAPAIAAVHEGKLRITPERWSRVYLDWLENIRPWCISRQLWWGHRLPVWYRGDDTYVGEEPPPGEGWERDPDVLDTWFSSGLWPFATLGWPEDTPQLRAFYPTDVLSTARDILFLWVARMVMLGIEFTGEVPFTDVNIHSVIQAPDGRRMSKSLGTGIDPLDLMEQYGADGVRFGLLAMSSTQDVKFSEEKVQQGSALTNKLFNASRLILMNAPDSVEPAPRPTRIEDRWILSRLERAKSDARARIAAFDFSKLALGLYDFVFSELCDWYLEMVKPRLYDGDEDAQATVLHVLRETLALAHPVIPFVTEDIWSLRWEGLLAAQTVSPPGDTDAPAERVVDDAIEIVRALRTWRESVGVKPKVEIRAALAAEGVAETEELIARLTRFDWSADGGEPAATIPVRGGSVSVYATEGLDLAAADRKRDAERERIAAEIKRAEGKLGNERFVAKAPPQLVAAEKEKLERLRGELEAL